MKCAFAGCSREAKTRGYCSKDYQRLWYNGQIESRTHAPQGAGERFLQQAIASDTDECIEWPYGLDQDGYGQVNYKGRHDRTNRFVCRAVHGEPPNSDAHAAHECGNPKCCNPRHLSWKSIKLNMHDKWRHGTMYAGARHHKTKLTEKQVLEILKDERGPTAIGRDYGVSKSAIMSIRKGKAWAILTGIRKAA